MILPDTHIMKLSSKNANLNIDYQPIDTKFNQELFLIQCELEDKGKISLIGDVLKLKQLQDGVVDNVFKRSEFHDYMLVKKSTLDHIEKYGLFTSLANIAGIERVIDFSKDIENDLKNNEYVIIQKVANPQNKFAWKDSNGALHCEPFCLNNYIRTELDDAHYRLDEFAEKLSVRSDVAFITHFERWAKKKTSILFAPLTGNEEDIGGVINEIQHHLEEGESMPEEKEEMWLVFYPNEHNINQVLFFDELKEGRMDEYRKRKLYNVERVIVRDILGGKEFYLAQDSLELELPKRKFKH